MRNHSTILLFWLIFSVPTLARAEFSLHASSHFGYGRMGNESTYPSRDMGTFNVQAMPGYRFASLLTAGLVLDYRLMSQLAEEREVGSDFSGRGFLWGLAIMAEPGPVKLLLGYDFRARHWYSGPDTTYKGSGIRFLLGYTFMPMVSCELEYTSTTYNTQEMNEQETGLNNNSIRHWNLALGLGLNF